MQAFKLYKQSNATTDLNDNHSLKLSLACVHTYIA